MENLLTITYLNLLNYYMENKVEESINILYIIVQMGMGGAERFVLTLIKKLDKKIYSPFVVYFYGDKIHPEFNDLNIPIIKITKKYKFDIKTMCELDSMIRRNNIKVVHAQHLMPMIYSFYATKIMRRIGLICTIHSSWEIEELPFRWRLIGAILLNGIDYVVGVTSDVAEAIKKVFKVNKKKVIVISNGIDVEKFKKNPKHKVIRKGLGIKESDIVIGTIGNLKKVKNQLFLIKAFKELIDEIKNVKLIIVGKGYKEDKDNIENDLKEYITKNGLEKDVFLLGYRADVAEILNEIDIFCLTSKMEGLPLSLIEAMGSGVPVIGTNVQGIRNVIEHKYDGLLVKEDDIFELNCAIMLLIKNSKYKDKLAKLGAEKVKKLYSLKSCTELHEEFYLRTYKNTSYYLNNQKRLLK